MIINDHITNDQLAQEILKPELIKHRAGTCDCREQGGQTYPCTANQWLRGAISSKEVIENYYDKQKN